MMRRRSGFSIMRAAPALAWLCAAAFSAGFAAPEALAAKIITVQGAKAGEKREDLAALSFVKLLRLAKKGDREAMLRVARRYEAGEKGARKSLAKAASWYRRAAQAGDAEAQYRLGRILHLGGRNIRQSAQMAVIFYRAAANQGRPEAMRWLAWCLEHGEGVARDAKKAAQWYEKAARAGLAPAMNDLGLLYLTGKGVRRDPARAFELFRRAAGRDDPWGINNLGAMHEMGWGAHKDLKKARAEYARAAKLGVAAARTNLARVEALLRRAGAKGGGEAAQPEPAAPETGGRP